MRLTTKQIEDIIENYYHFDFRNKSHPFFSNADTAFERFLVVCHRKEAWQSLLAIRVSKITALHMLCQPGLMREKTAKRSASALKALLLACKNDLLKESHLTARDDRQQTLLHLVCYHGFSDSKISPHALVMMKTILGACSSTELKGQLVLATAPHPKSKAIHQPRISSQV